MSDATPPPPPPQNPYGGQAQLSPADEKLWSTLVHLGGILWIISLPLIPALVGYLVLKNRGPFVRAHTADALNFQISMVIYVIGSVILSAILIFLIIGLFLIWILPLVIGVLVIVFSIIAAVKANQGQLYRYPLTIKFVR
ncbi:MAG: DUF4870 domain-containing protein [Leifsonia sp.]